MEYKIKIYKNKAFPSSRILRCDTSSLKDCVNVILLGCCTISYETNYSKNGPSKICGRQPVINLKEYGLKGCLPQILLGASLSL